MRLLAAKTSGQFDNFSLTEYSADTIPPYAILSHTWGEDGDEVIYNDLIAGTGKNKPGYEKLRFCGEQAARDGLKYFWIDTCCIDKSDNAELSKAINSMFRWYRAAARCYVYLSDVGFGADNQDPQSESDQYTRSTWETAFRKSRWFTRGWTLQELIAPAIVEFFSKERKRLGDKKSLEQQIHEITGVSLNALQGNPLSQFSVAQRASWADKRHTKHEEDMAYSLLGIFDISMPLIYGEGKEEAIFRLYYEIDKHAKRHHNALSTAPITLSTPGLPIQKYWKVARRVGGHSDTVLGIAFSPDNKILASASADRTIKLWDLPTGGACRTLIGHSGAVVGVAFSPDGKLIASASGDRTVRLWDSVTGECRILEGHEGSLRAVAFSPDSKVVASASQDRTVRIWDSATGEACGTLSGHYGWVSHVAFSPDGKLLASGSEDKTVRIWDWVTRKVRHVLEGHSNWAKAVAFSPNGNLLVSGSHDKTLMLWDSATGKACGTLRGHSHIIRDVAFSPDGKLIASASYDKTIRLWDSATGAACGIFEGHWHWVLAVAFSPDSKALASASADRTVMIWELATGGDQVKEQGGFVLTPT
ncbi:hypothetical protein IFR05_014919 [Cadophora sp. M221]|nr:hypothetical protein IFR05_014919 [Cadophora sp. M221]